jgi:cellulose synthase/poly-beta-1,6-N-acetylglucosamine synthase-like glycosyltransferase
LFFPHVSVVIPVYNGELDLPDLITCLREQTYPNERVEYLLVDNNSCDRTPLILQQAAQEAASQGVTLRILQENKIQSSYAARNTGIHASKAEIIAFTDADCRPQPTWLATLMQPFVEPQIGVVAGEIVALPGKTLLEQHAEREKALSQQHTLDHLFYPYGQTANLAIRRKILEQVGLFRPYLTTGGDADMCWRIQIQTDYRLQFAPTAVVQHRHRQTLRELKSQWQRYGRSNRYLHELHGVDLRPEVTAQEYVYQLVRWVVKEVPINSAKAIARKATLVDILKTPINLLNVRARAAGQREAKLPESAKEIEWLSTDGG